MSDPAAAHRRRGILRVQERRAPSRPLPIAGWIAVGAVAIVLFWVTVPLLVGVYDLPLHVAFGLATLQCVTLPLAVHFPRSAMLLHVISIVVIGTVTRERIADEFWPLPIPDLITLMVILVILGLRESWIVSVAAWWASFLAMTVVVVVNVTDQVPVSEWGVDVLISVSVTLVALGVSIFIGQRGRVREIVADAKRDVELEQARRATVEERARIARELHDVVAHSMSLVHIQAESAQYRIDDLDTARTEFADIARSARSALAEMRQLLEALRPGDETLYAPQPSLAELPTLIEGTRRAGSPVAVTSDVDPARLSPVLQLTVYRIIQEALSNVIRHAPHASIDVTLRRDSGSLSITVRNSPPPGHAPAIGRRMEDSGGHGLRGMRERVELIHGTLDHTPLPGGGYLITATLPIPEREEPS